MLLNISTLTPATQRYVGSGQNGEVELRRQTPTPSGPKYLQQIFWFFLCDPRRTCRFCTRVGLAISEYHPIDEYKLQIA